jgi:predicted AAA+ superfamily ATPase
MSAFSAFRLLFYTADAFGKPEAPAERILRLIGSLLDGTQTADKLNTLARETNAEDIAEKINGAIFEAFVSRNILPKDFLSDELSEDAKFLLKKALILLDELKKLPLLPDEKERENILPSAREIFSLIPDYNGNIKALAAALADSDPFRTHRVFGYSDGVFRMVNPSSVKNIDRFFGYLGVRQALSDHFKDFAAGKTSLPLLINSLPGYGKTSMVISFALSVPDTVVILPEPETLEDSWQQLINRLSARQDRRFVIFFDDIDPRSVNWYNFRTNVGGAFTPPKNIMPVLTANYEFPTSILSRGRRISYPVFDEERCLEMIEDFLATFGMKKPPRNIVSLMGAEYTEEFGQKKFTELSPRTLMRHLALYENDQRKRKQIVELSGGGMITRPDAELFYEFNIELMRSLYGEEYIQRLLKERLRSL